MAVTVRCGDWVRCKAMPDSADGLVCRVARDGSWADVRWCDGGAEWSKRMPTWTLEVVATIRRSIDGQEWEITDVTRERELREAR